MDGLSQPPKQDDSSYPEFLAFMVELIDEVMRGHGRIVALADTFSEPGDPVGLERTVLTSVVEAQTPPTVPQIGRSLGYPRQTIQRQADRLVKSGLLEWIDNPDHKTAKRLVGTENGRHAHQRAAANSLKWAEQFGPKIKGCKVGEAVRTLRQIRKALETEARAQHVPTAHNPEKHP